MSEVSLTSKLWGTGGELVDPAGTPAADTTDAGDFQRWLQEEPQSDDASPSALGAVLRSAAASLHEREHEFNKTLRREARTGDLVDGLAVQRQLSELHLSHSLAVKVIGKATQALETLTRLQ